MLQIDSTYTFTALLNLLDSLLFRSFFLFQLWFAIFSAVSHFSHDSMR